MRVLSSVLLAVSSAFAYQVTFPGGSQGWNTTGPNYLKWERVDTDPLNFTAVLTNMNSPNNQVLNAVVDGTLGSVVCNAPTGGWPTGSGFRVNLAQNSQQLDSLLAQSSEFNITAVSSTTSSSSVTMATSATGTTSSLSVSSSDTSTTPTGTSAGSPGADPRMGFLVAVVALTTLITTLF